MQMTDQPKPVGSFGWAQVVRLGLVQACIGSVVVMTTSTLNRVMVVELALPALIPGVLVALHYLVQLARPRMGFGSDTGGRSTPWILGGMGTLALGGTMAAAATALMGTQVGLGIALAALAFVLIGLGVSASGTALLVLLAKRVPAPRRAASATLVWIMMIMGFALTAGGAGSLLDPYSPARLVGVMAGVCTLACVVTALALHRLEVQAPAAEASSPLDTSTAPREPGWDSANSVVPAASSRERFSQAFAQVWAEPDARRFSVFVFVSMLAYSSQDLILEPFAGSVFAMTPGESTRLSGLQHGGVLLGMLLVAAAGSGWLGARARSLRAWAIGGCIASALALIALVLAGQLADVAFLKAAVVALGVANGAFSIAAISTMMRLASHGRGGREGVRMGLWGAAQAMAFGLGGLVGTGASDLAHALMQSSGSAYAAVFLFEALLFGVSAGLAARIREPAVPEAHGHPLPRAASPLRSATATFRHR